MVKLLLATLLLVAAFGTEASVRRLGFAHQPSKPSLWQQRWPHTTKDRRQKIGMKEGGKGFGKVPVPPEKPSKPMASADEPILQRRSPPLEFPEVSTGAQVTLEEMRRKREQQLVEADLRYQELLEVDATLRENPDAGVIPEKVAQRMLFRMLPLAAVPIFGGVGLFVVFYFAATNWDLEVPPTIVAYATTVPWLLGLAGLTYGLLSASWDPEIEGSFLGVDEFKINMGRIVDGVRRSGQNREFRDQYENYDQDSER